jgi:AcrR family transcriptional regulator
VSTERSYHHGNLRSELLSRAWDVVDTTGVDDLSLRQLARDSGVSHGASSRHFRDKQALLDALAIEGFRRLNTSLADAASAAGTYAERFRTVGDAYVAFAVAHPAMLGVMYTAKHHPAASDDLVELSHVGMGALVELIEQAQDAGAVGAGPARQHALVAFAAVHGVATLATDDLLEGVPWRDAAAATISFVWTGLST